jgi:predicted transcriptional regulator
MEADMLEAIFGSEGAERVLLFLAAREKGYAQEIASFSNMHLNNVQNHLRRMERDGLLVSQSVGRTRVFKFNPRYAFKAEVQALLQKALTRLPPTLHDELVLRRTRPRRSGKPS